jgi:hypothetical protein
MFASLSSYSRLIYMQLGYIHPSIRRTPCHDIHPSTNFLEPQIAAYVNAVYHEHRRAGIMPLKEKEKYCSKELDTLNERHHADTMPEKRNIVAQNS